MIHAKGCERWWCEQNVWIVRRYLILIISLWVLAYFWVKDFSSLVIKKTANAKDIGKIIFMISSSMGCPCLMFSCFIVAYKEMKF
jgi:hypothetical protein